MSNNSMRESIIKCVKFGGISFVEMEREIEGMKGDRVLLLKYESLILWVDVSQEFIDEIGQLVSEGIITFQGCSPLIYSIDGKMLNLPIAKSFRDYKKPRWLPVVFRAV